MANNTAIKIVFGGASFMAGDVAEAEKFLLALEEEGIKIIDTGAVYGKSEEVLGATNAASRFTIDTKFGGGLIPVEKSKEDVVKSGEESLRKLKTDSVS
jgi:aryl-alcohol dehydrogenase-like predicted oxidoreductase